MSIRSRMVCIPRLIQMSLLRTYKFTLQNWRFTSHKSGVFPVHESLSYVAPGTSVHHMLGEILRD